MQKYNVYLFSLYSVLHIKRFKVEKKEPCRIEKPKENEEAKAGSVEITSAASTAKAVSSSANAVIPKGANG